MAAEPICSVQSTATSSMAQSLAFWLTLIGFLTPAFSYVDFGTVTRPCAFEPAFNVPRPPQLPDDVWMRYAPYSSHLMAIAPSVRLLSNGSQSISLSLHSQAKPTRTLEHPGLRRRGVFSGDLGIPTCRPCDGNNNPINSGNGTGGSSPTCSLASYNVGDPETLPLSH